MVYKVEELDFSRDIKKDELLSVLKKEVSVIHIRDIMMASSFLREDAKYMQQPYRDEYINRFTKAFFTRIKDVKDDQSKYEGYIDSDKLQDLLEVLENQKKEAKNDGELCFLKIAKIIAIYTTYILEESIHPVGTKFPGGFKLRYKDGEYLCPVKERQMDNPSALCRFCVSKQDKNV
ncbi:MAG: DUF2115 domain-containing protein [Euryarchaeota archaeon]|nr:DUF2115 domain-containing protein [Euryarchaeota archaeon]